MGNYTITEVKVHSSRVVMDKIKFELADIASGFEIKPNGDMWIRTRGINVREKLVGMSLKLLAARITATHSYEADNFSKKYSCEYFYGVCTLKDIKLNYIIPNFFSPDGVDEEAVKNKALEILSRTDTVEIDGNFYTIDTNEDVEIKAAFMHGDYRIEAIKKGQDIDIKVYDKMEVWEEIKLPF